MGGESSRLPASRANHGGGGESVGDAGGAGGAASGRFCCEDGAQRT